LLISLIRLRSMGVETATKAAKLKNTAYD
jgi:hypothetical protein